MILFGMVQIHDSMTIINHVSFGTDCGFLRARLANADVALNSHLHEVCAQNRAINIMQQ